MLLSFLFSSIVTWVRGKKNNKKVSVERHSSHLFMGKQNPLKWTCMYAFIFFNEQTVRYLKVHFDLINMSKSTLYF